MATYRKRIACALAGVLMLTSCTGSSATESTEVPATDAATTASVSPTNAEIEAAAVYADRLIAHLDDDVDAAFDAVAYALNNGYDGTQITDAIDTDTLGTDGRIPDVAPNLTPPDLLEPQGQGLLRRADDESPEPKLPIEKFRDAAYTSAARYGEQDDPRALGRFAVAFISALATAGLSMEQIIETLVFGIDTPTTDTTPTVTEPRIIETTPAATVVEAVTSVTAADAGDTERFIGTLVEFLPDSDGAEILIDRAEFVVEGGTLSGTAEALANIDFLGEPACFSLRFDLVDIPSSGPDTYAGAATASGAIPDGNCPGGPPAAEASLELSIDATVSGDELSVNVTGYADDPVTVIADRAT